MQCFAWRLYIPMSSPLLAIPSYTTQSFACGSCMPMSSHPLALTSQPMQYFARMHHINLGKGLKKACMGMQDQGMHVDGDAGKHAMDCVTWLYKSL